MRLCSRSGISSLLVFISSFNNNLLLNKHGTMILRDDDLLRHCRSRVWQTMGHAVRMLISVWVASLLVMMPIPIVSRLDRQSSGTRTIELCSEAFPECVLLSCTRFITCLHQTIQFCVSNIICESEKCYILTKKYCIIGYFRY